MSGSTLSSYKAVAATQIRLIDLGSDGKTDSLTAISVGSWVMHIALFPFTWGWVYRPQDLILSLRRLTYRKVDLFRTVGTPKGQCKCHIWMLKGWQFIWNDGTSQCLENSYFIIWHETRQIKKGKNMNVEDGTYLRSNSLTQIWRTRLSMSWSSPCSYFTIA